MPFYRSIRQRRGRKKLGNQQVELQLTSMMDILVIILVFLLKSYATATHNFTTLPGMELPISSSPDIPIDSLQVIVTPEGMTFESVRVVEFQQSMDSVGDAPTYTLRKQDLDEGGRRIVPLYDALLRAKERSEILRAKSKARDAEGNPLPFEGTLAIQADKHINYDTVRKVMYTAATAGYRTFRFLARERDQ